MRTNADLIHAFAPIISTAGVGLDAVDISRNNEIWFSTEVGFWATMGGSTAQWIGPGDLLSDAGYVVRTNAELLANFDLLISTTLPGLDAVALRPNGEIYFSTEEGFLDGTYGQISEGDLLSDAGYVVARNYELIRRFNPDDIDDVGLDAVRLGRQLSCPTLSPAANPDSAAP
jgi:hypothetical protein